MKNNEASLAGQARPVNRRPNFGLPGQGLLRQIPGPGRLAIKGVEAMGRPAKPPGRGNDHLNDVDVAERPANGASGKTVNVHVRLHGIDS